MRRFLLYVAILSLPVLVFGQAETTGRVIGTVVDQEGNPIGDARIRFISPALQGERIDHTAEDGGFLAALLPVGSYAVEVTAPGKETVSVSFRVGVGQTMPLDVTLRSGEKLTEEITVRGEISKLETTTLGENLDYAETIEELPIQDRTLEGTARYAPNIGFGPTGAVSGFANAQLAISGAPSTDTVTLLDGAEISDPYFGMGQIAYLEDAIEEVQVLGSGISARYGRFQGGVVNAVTKTGGNSFDGTIRMEFSNQKWDSRTPFGEEQEDHVNHAIQGTLGGYLIKDRLWFFAGYRTEDISRAFTTSFTGDSVTFDRSDDRWQLKLRGAITPNHIVQLSRFEREWKTSNEDFITAEPAAVMDGTMPIDYTVLTYQGVLTPTLFLDFQLTALNVSIEEGGDPSTGRSTFYDAVQGEVFNNGILGLRRDPDVRDNRTAGLNFTQSLRTKNWGSHTLEYGVQYVESITRGWNPQSPTPYTLGYFQELDEIPFVTVGEDDLIFNMSTYEAYRIVDAPQEVSPKATVNNLALYVQDSWRVDRWRFDLGLRWDKYEGDGTYFSKTVDYDVLAPRLGVTFDITPTWQIQATYGKYVGKMNDMVTNILTGVLSNPGTVEIYVGEPQLDLSRDEMEAVLRDDDQWIVIRTKDPRLGLSEFDPNLESPYANDFNLSVKKGFDQNNGTVTLTYTNRQFRNFVEDFVGGYGTAETPNGVQDVWYYTNDDIAKREYEALTAAWDYSPSAIWNIGGNWTYAKLRGNFESEYAYGPTVRSWLGDYEGSYPQSAASPFGYLNADCRHRFQAWGNYRFDFGKAGSLTLGSILFIRSGYPWSREASVRMADLPEYVEDGGQSYPHHFDGRGNNRFDGYWSWDISARYQFPIRRGLSGWFKVNVVNVLNNDALVHYSTNGQAVSATTGELWNLITEPIPFDQPVWEPLGNCGPGDTPSTECTGFGRVTGADDYQMPRSFLLTLGLQF